MNHEPIKVGARVIVVTVVKRYSDQLVFDWRRPATLLRYRHIKDALHSYYVVKIDGIMGEHEYSVQASSVREMDAVEQLADLVE